MHPYKNLPEHNYWKSGIGEKFWADVNFKPNVKFKLSPRDKIATAGSCFAQHLARNLPALGLNHCVYEAAPTILSPARAGELQYGQFSARYGNIYTARQLRQVIEFAFQLRPLTHMGVETPTGWADLLRPGIQTEGFDSEHDLICDRVYHYECVKQLFLSSDCFIFTLGLTEAWYDNASGLVFPACPGTRIGRFDPALYKFVNFDAFEIIEDLTWCVNFIKDINPELKWIFTVSPVALAATATDNNVQVATTSSKSTLRVAADYLCKKFAHCDYFPSFEIVSSTATFGQFLDGDLRNISSRGVNFVMQNFKKSFVESEPHSTQPEVVADVAPARSLGDQLKSFANAECDEMFNDPNNTPH
jgi:hypothetical protein